jgi:hypothetical protein
MPSPGSSVWALVTQSASVVFPVQSNFQCVTTLSLLITFSEAQMINNICLTIFCHLLAFKKDIYFKEWF